MVMVLIETVEIAVILIMTAVITVLSFKKDVPIYLKIILFGIWCEAITLVYEVVMEICVPEANLIYSLMNFGKCGALAFFYLANRVFLKSQGKEKKYKKESAIALVAPATVMAIMLIAFINSAETDAFVIAMMIFFGLFLPIGAYSSLKMLLIKSDEVENLRRIKPINAAVLILTVLVSLILAALLRYDEFGVDLMSSLAFAIEIVIVALCGLERKKWKT